MYSFRVQESEEEISRLATAKFDFFAVNFHEEFSVLSGELLAEQRDFVAEAVNRILELYKLGGAKAKRARERDILYKRNLNRGSSSSTASREAELEPKNPQSVILWGHSMGGVVARSVFAAPNFVQKSVRFIFTLSTPHEIAPILVSSSVHGFYSQMHQLWDDDETNSVAGTETKISSNSQASNQHVEHKGDEAYLEHQSILNARRETSSTVLVSISNGPLDIQVSTPYSVLRGSYNNRLFVESTSIPHVWATMDHQSSMWCNQLVRTLANVFASLVDPTTLQTYNMLSSTQKNVKSGHDKSAKTPTEIISKIRPFLQSSMGESSAHLISSPLTTTNSQSKIVSKSAYITSGKSSISAWSVSWVSQASARTLSIFSSLPVDDLQLYYCVNAPSKASSGEKKSNAVSSQCFDFKNSNFAVSYRQTLYSEQYREFRTRVARVWEISLPKKNSNISLSFFPPEVSEHETSFVEDSFFAATLGPEQSTLKATRPMELFGFALPFPFFLRNNSQLINDGNESLEFVKSTVEVARPFYDWIIYKVSVTSLRCRNVSRQSFDPYLLSEESFEDRKDPKQKMDWMVGENSFGTNSILLKPSLLPKSYQPQMRISVWSDPQCEYAVKVSIDAGASANLLLKIIAPLSLAVITSLAFAVLSLTISRAPHVLSEVRSAVPEKLLSAGENISLLFSLFGSSRVSSSWGYVLLVTLAAPAFFSNFFGKNGIPSSSDGTIGGNAHTSATSTLPSDISIEGIFGSIPHAFKDMPKPWPSLMESAILLAFASSFLLLFSNLSSIITSLVSTFESIFSPSTPYTIIEGEKKDSKSTKNENPSGGPSSSNSGSNSPQYHSIQIQDEEITVTGVSDFIRVVTKKGIFVFVFCALLAVFAHPAISLVISLIWLLMPRAKNEKPSRRSVDEGPGAESLEKGDSLRLSYPSSFVASLPTLRHAHFLAYSMALFTLGPDALVWAQRLIRILSSIAALPLSELNSFSSLSSNLDMLYPLYEFMGQSIASQAMGAIPLSIAVSLHTLLLRTLPPSVILHKSYFDTPRLTALVSALSLLLFAFPVHGTCDCLLWLSCSFLSSLLLLIFSGPPASSNQQS